MGPHSAGTTAARSGWSVAVQTGAALAGAMGVGRFVFTPVLPLMEAQAHLTSAQASTLATSNYLGYLIGAILGIMLPALSRARLALRVSGIVLVVTLAAMPLTRDVAAWAALRGLAGVASAVIFMVAGNMILTELTSGRPHMIGWAYGGVGVGIALSGALVAVVKPIGDWQAVWWSSAALTALLLAAAWFVGVTGAAGEARRRLPIRGPRRGTSGGSPFSPGLTSWREPATSSPGRSWSRPSPRLGRRGCRAASGSSSGPPPCPPAPRGPGSAGSVSRPTLITGALILQAIGIALPAFTAAVPAALAAAVLFGATFIGITTLSPRRTAPARPPGRRHPHRRLWDRPGPRPAARGADLHGGYHQALLASGGAWRLRGRRGGVLLRVGSRTSAKTRSRSRGYDG